MRIRTKLALMMLLPLAGLGVLVTMDVARAYDSANKARTQRQFADVVVRLGAFVHAVQDERSASAGTRFSADLASRRAKTDTALVSLRATTASVDSSRYTKRIRAALTLASRQVDSLTVVRNGVSAHEETPIQVLDSYSDLVDSHLDIAGSMAGLSADVETARRVSSYLALAHANEQLAIAQSAGIFGLKDRTATALAAERAYADQFRRTADSDDVEAYTAAGDSLTVVRAVEDTLAADLQQRATDVHTAAVRSEVLLITASLALFIVAAVLALGLAREVMSSLTAVT